VVGDLIGQGAAQEQTVVGETPNLAARLQTLAAPGSVVISQATRRLVGGLFELTELDAQTLKGFAAPVRAWQVTAEGQAESRFQALHGARLTPLIGRDEELALLMSRWRRAKAGEGQVVLLTGEPGVGKSRIVQALRELLEDEPTPLSVSSAPPATSTALYTPSSASLSGRPVSVARTRRRTSSLSLRTSSHNAPNGCARWFR
jgi:hypothetical protein